MSLPQIFQFTGLDVRSVLIDGAPWWVAKDVCDVLGISNHFHAVHGRPGREGNGGLDDDEKGMHFVTTPSGNQEMLVVNESGLYSLILRSRKPEAKAFKRWITHEVIPAIRKTGTFNPAVPQTLPEALRLAASLSEMVLEHTATIQKQEQNILYLAPKAEFADSVADSVEVLKLAEFAKIAQIPTIWKWLVDEKLFFQERDRKLPYQSYVDRGYFKLIERVWTDPDGKDHITSSPRITGKGQIWVLARWRSSQMRAKGA